MTLKTIGRRVVKSVTKVKLRDYQRERPIAEMTTMMKKICCWFVMKVVAVGAAALVLASAPAAAVTIDAVYFAQTHVHQPNHPYFSLVGNKDILIKAYVVDPATPAAPAVTATLTLGAQSTNLILTGPAILPASIPNGFGVVQHSFTNSFTNTIPKAWAKSGLTTWAQDLGDIQTPAAPVAVTVSSVFLTQPRLYIRMRADRQSHPMPHPKIFFNP